MVRIVILVEVTSMIARRGFHIVVLVIVMDWTMVVRLTRVTTVVVIAAGMTMDSVWLVRRVENEEFARVRHRGLVVVRRIWHIVWIVVVNGLWVMKLSVEVKMGGCDGGVEI